MKLKKNFQIILFATSIFLYFGTTLFASETGENSFFWLKKIPVLEEGRIKPLDTYARNVLLQLSGRRTFDKKPAIEWVSKLLFSPETTLDDKVFLINHPDIPAALGITPEVKRRYSYSQLEKGESKLIELNRAALEMDEHSRSLVDREIIRIAHGLVLYEKLGNSFQFAYPHPEFTVKEKKNLELLGLSEKRDTFSFLEIALQADKLESVLREHGTIKPNEWDPAQKEMMGILSKLFQWSLFYTDLPFTIIPSHLPEEEETWLSPWDVISKQFTIEKARKEIQVLTSLAIAYRSGDVLRRDLSVRQFLDSIKDRGGSTFKRVSKHLDLEVFYNQANFFFWAKLLYLSSLLFFIIYLLAFERKIYGVSVALMFIGFGLHATALAIRIILLARPPVTNLYETFIFVGAISVFIGLILEHFNRKGIGLLVASISGVTLLLIANRYSAEGDTLRMLVAVLNSNFWLSIHVPTITMGYAASCVAGLLGHFYLVQGCLPRTKLETLQMTFRYLMGTLGLGLILTFFGTCLGGIWADQSWGRFWGWDPKENGALMIVIWTALIFHAKMAGLVKNFGVAVLAVLGMLVVVWAWFGVNLLSVGLHSYGFTSGLMRNLLIYVLAEILFLVTTFLFFQRKKQIPAGRNF